MPNEKHWLPAKWDYEADVVVVGYGTAGAAVAIEAHDAGANVLVLEKQRADTPTFIDHTPSVRMSTSATATPTNVAAMAEYIELSQKGHIPKDHCQVLAEELSQNKAWLESLGAKLVKSRDIQMGKMPMIPWFSPRSSAVPWTIGFPTGIQTKYETVMGEPGLGLK